MHEPAIPWMGVEPHGYEPRLASKPAVKTEPDVGLSGLQGVWRAAFFQHGRQPEWGLPQQPS